MILRIWHGWTPPANADAYQRLLDEVIVPGILAREIDGLRDVRVLRDHQAGADEVAFVTLMQFDHWDAVETFAGPGGTASVVPEEARRLLCRFDDHSQHYDLVATHRARQHPSPMTPPLQEVQG